MSGTLYALSTGNCVITFSPSWVTKMIMIVFLLQIWPNQMQPVRLIFLQQTSTQLRVAKGLIMDLLSGMEWTLSKNHSVISSSVLQKFRLYFSKDLFYHYALHCALFFLSGFVVGRLDKLCIRHFGNNKRGS
jgi:hypothetical protein